MPVNRVVGLSLGAAILLCSSTLNLAHAKPFMIVGNDEKVSGTMMARRSCPDGKDSVLIVDSRQSEDPKIDATPAPEEFDRRTAGQFSTSTRPARSRWWRIPSMSPGRRHAETGCGQQIYSSI